MCALDILKGGVLLALPALLVSGLSRHSAKYSRLPASFYGLTSIFLLLAFHGATVGRFRSIEALGMAAWYARDAPLEKKLAGVVEAIEGQLGNKTV